MLVVCPDCVSSYRVDPSVAAAGRPSTHCAHCRRPLQAEPIQALAAAPVRERSAVPGLLAAAATLMIVSALLGGRHAIVAAAPALAPLYAAVGLDPRPVLPAVTDVKTGWDRDALTVTATVANPGAVRVTLPPLRITIRDGASDSLTTWTASAPQASLGAGETVSVTQRLDKPPAQGHDLVVGFAAERLDVSGAVAKGMP